MKYILTLTLLLVVGCGESPEQRMQRQLAQQQAQIAQQQQLLQSQQYQGYQQPGYAPQMAPQAPVVIQQPNHDSSIVPSLAAGALGYMAGKHLGNNFSAPSNSTPVYQRPITNVTKNYYNQPPVVSAPKSSMDMSKLSRSSSSRTYSKR